MKKYDSYKSSGVEWIGDVPEKWNIMKLKFLASYNDEVLPEKTDANQIINYVEISDVNCSDGIVNTTEYEFKEAPSRARRITKKGDVIISTVRTYLKAIAKVNEDGLIASTGFIVLRPKKINESYLAYSALSDNFIFDVLSQSVGVSYPAINASQIVNIKIPLPPKEEQVAIAAYLDAKCAKIDNVLAVQQKRIELLKELKQSIITNAVTKGLDKNAELKPSGIDWICDCPKNWKRCRFKDFLGLVNESASGGEKIGLENIEKGSGRFLPTETEFEGEGTAFREGDVVYGKLRPYLMKVWVAEFEGNAVGDFFVFRTKNNAKPNFVKYLMLSDGFTKATNGAVEGAKMPRVPSEFIMTLPYFLPPKEEQIAIAAYLDSKCVTIDKQIEKVQRQIDLLKEYKQSIITECVTGKRKVC